MQDIDIYDHASKMSLLETNQDFCFTCEIIIFFVSIGQFGLLHNTLRVVIDVVKNGCETLKSTLTFQSIFLVNLCLPPHSK